MGFMAQRGSGSVTWANVADGALKVGDKTYGGFAGYITGIRTRPNIYNGKETTKLEIRMSENIETDDVVIVTGTLYNTDGSVTTWGRMIVARLVREGAPGPGEMVEIGVYGAGESRATCASLRRRGDPTALQGDDRLKSRTDEHGRTVPDARTVRSLVEGFVAHLCTVYPWGERGAGGHDDESEGGGWHAVQRGGGQSRTDTYTEREENFPQDDGLPF